MTPNTVTLGRPLRSAALALALLVVGCTTVTPAPSLGPTNPPVVQTPAPTAKPPASPAGLTPIPQETTGTPTATPTPSAIGTDQPTTPPQSSGPATPGPTIDPATASQIDAVVAQVPPIRELQPTKTVPYQLISRDDFSNYLMSTSDEDATPDWRAAEGRFLIRLGLLPQGSNLDQLLLQLYTAEVAAYYDPATGTFYIIQTGKPFGPVDEVTVSHEYTHALQDQHFDLEGNRIKDPVQGDAALGQLAVIEGDATLTSQNWMKANMSESEQLQLLQDSIAELGTDQLASMPLILRRQLEFPYTEGFLFTSSVWGLGGYDAVNQAIQTPPASTEQVLHDDKYFNHEAPMPVTVTDLTSTLGGGWSNVYQQVMGELNIQVLATGGEKPPIDIPGFPNDWPHQEVAAGWGGDKLNMYENTDGQHWLIDWETAWDTATDATEFTTRMTELESNFQGHLVLQPGTEPNSVRFMLADSVDTMNLVQPPT